MIELYFTVDKNNHLVRTDTNTIVGGNSDYLCHFEFSEDNPLSHQQKYAQFTNTNKETYVALLDNTPICQTAIPYNALTGCTLKVSVYGGDTNEEITSTNAVMAIVIPSGYEETSQSTQEEFTDAFIDAYNRLSDKFDDVSITDENIHFYGEGREVAVLSLENLMLTQQSDWNETNTESPRYIKNKPNIPEIQDNLIEEDDRKHIDGLSKNQGIIINNSKMDNNALDNKLTKTIILERDSVINGTQYYAGDIITYIYSPNEI